MGRFKPSDASGAIPLLPLAKEIKRAGLLYREIYRKRDVAVYCAKGKGDRIEFELVKIQILPAEEIGEKSYPAREGFPSTSEWGESGWTFTNNSHHDPLAAAMDKATQITGRGKPHPEATESQEAEV
jgi:hypothetical protein